MTEKQSIINGEPLTIDTEVIKIRNSSSRYIKLPDNKFEQIKHGDIANKIFRKEDNNYIYVIFAFEKRNKNESDK